MNLKSMTLELRGHVAGRPDLPADPESQVRSVIQKRSTT